NVGEIDQKELPSTLTSRAGAMDKRKHDLCPRPLRGKGIFARYREPPADTTGREDHMSICAMRRGHTLFQVGLRNHLVLELRSVVLGLPQLALEAAAQQQLEDPGLGARTPIAHAMVALWAESADAPARLSETQSNANGHFALPFAGAPTGA